MSVPKFAQVSKEGFAGFVKAYPNELEGHTTTICEPIQKGLYDWSIAVGTEGEANYAFSARVAYIVCNWLGPNDETASGDEFYKYYVRQMDG